MATNRKMDDDEEMLLPGGDNVHVQQPYFAQPQVQQPYPGAASAPPAYASPHPHAHQAYPPGHAVPMGQMGASGTYSHNTTVVINQPAPVVRAGPRVWSSTMCSCCDDMGSCLLGTFCPLVLACQVSMDMEESMCVPCCVPGWLNVLRTKLRAENNIEGTVMDDCCMSMCCHQCVLCQMSRELKFIRRSYQPSQ